MNKLTHIDDDGSIKMVDISEKEITTRFARGCGRIEMSPDTMDMLVSGKAKKGNVLETARLAGIMAAKKNSDLIP
ncbi:cyclic pyranopterin monophosphate synthase MoaC, partial [bacterium]|nr:cyclic pyranopterin monophosphate synthase MoaC [bacterium]